MLLTALSQKLIAWLCIDTYRVGRGFLEANTVLLTPDSDFILHTLLTQYAEDPNERQKLHHHIQILHDIRAKGGTIEAIREVYVNSYGGLTLDLPSWLERVECQLAELAGAPQTDRVTTIYKLLLHDTVQRTAHDPCIAPEVCAELQFLLAEALIAVQCRNCLQLLKTAMMYYQKALRVYTHERYPQQYTRIQVAIKKKRLFSIL